MLLSLFWCSGEDWVCVMVRALAFHLFTDALSHDWVGFVDSPGFSQGTEVFLYRQKKKTHDWICLKPINT